MLTVRECMALEIAATPYRHPAIRDDHVREQLGYSPTRYWAIVDALLDRRDALAEMPATVRRLRRVREARAAARRAG